MVVIVLIFIKKIVYKFLKKCVGLVVFLGLSLGISFVLVYREIIFFLDFKFLERKRKFFFIGSCRISEER